MGRRYLAAALRRAVHNARAPLLEVIVALLLSSCSPDRPDFSAIRDVPTLKGAFAEFLLPMIASENSRLSEQRNTLTGLHNTFRQQGDLGWWATRRLQRLAAEYALETEALSTEAILDELALRIDIIPADLALMQAAKESG